MFQVNKVDEQPFEVLENSLQRSKQDKKSVIYSDYQVHLGEAHYDIGQVKDPVTCK